MTKVTQCVLLGSLSLLTPFRHILLLGGLVLIPSLSFAEPLKVTTTDGLYDNSVYSPIIDLIHSAQSSVQIEIYTMKDQNVRNEIRAAMNRNVAVQIVEEPTPVEDTCHPFTGQSSSDADCADLTRLIQEVRAKGGQFVPFNKDLCGGGSASFNSQKSCVEHGKMTIIDQSVVMLSTGNYDYTNLCDSVGNSALAKCDRDYSYVTRDPAIVSSLEAIFQHDLSGSPYNLASLLPQGSSFAATQSLIVSPDSLDPIVAFIDAAQRELIVENQYLNEPTMNAAIVRAAKRGVDVTVLTASVCSYGSVTPTDQKRVPQIYGAFDAAGVKSRMFTKNNRVGGKPGYLHAKTMVRDGNVAFVGSQNGSSMALTENREFGLIIQDSGVAQELRSLIVNDLMDAGSETWSQAMACSEGGTAEGHSPVAVGSAPDLGGQVTHGPKPSGSPKPPRPHKPHASELEASVTPEANS